VSGRASPSETSFLHGRSLSQGIKALARAEELDLAVAFWGNGASELLGISDGRARIRIVCDLMSGACNPHELRRLRLTPGVAIRNAPGLHAKVYLAPTEAIVCSANASANGLGFEDAEVEFQHEAGLRTTAQLDKIRAWFDGVWSTAGSEITDGDLEAAAGLWKQRRNHRPLPKQPSLLRALGDAPSAFDDRRVFVWAYRDEPPSKGALAAYQAVSQRYEPKRRARYDADGEFPFYELSGLGGVQPGDYIIDLSVSRSRLVYRGLWRVKPDDPFLVVDPKTHLVLLDKVNSAFGLRLPDPEGRAIATAATNLWQSARISEDAEGGILELSLAEFAQMAWPAGDEAIKIRI